LTTYFGYKLRSEVSLTHFPKHCAIAYIYIKQYGHYINIYKTIILSLRCGCSWMSTHVLFHYKQTERK